MQLQPEGQPDHRTLNYAKQAPYLRRRLIIRFVVATVALTLLGSAWRWGPTVGRRTQMLYWQRQCDRFVGPSDRECAKGSPQCLKHIIPGFGDYRTESQFLFVHRREAASGLPT